MNHLSQVTKLDNVKSFDLPLSTCLDRCKYYDIGICYAKIKVLRVCKNCHMVKFAIMVNSDIILSQLIQSGFKIPKNTNLLLSNYEPNTKTPEFMKNYLRPYNIGVTQTTLKSKLATCQASTVKNGHCLDCEKCYYDKDITFKIHGRFNKQRILNK